MLRIIDANLNRLGEGLRVLEEVTRFVLNDPELTAKLKGLRHDLIAATPESEVKLLIARDSEGDVSAFAETPGEIARADVLSVAMANARRVQQALRVLEEFGKLPDSPLSMAQIKRARFVVYDVERRMVSGLLRQEQRKKVKGLYFILDPETLKGRDQREVAVAALRGGARIIQLRDKTRDKGLILPFARELKQLCAEHNALLIINDDADLAYACDADGVHLGQKDLPIEAVRPILPLKVIGVSTNNVEEARKAQDMGADYVAVGCLYPSPTKCDARPAGPSILAEIKKSVAVPVVGIGGINESNAAEVFAAGADAIAVISAVASAKDPEAAARRLAEIAGAPREAH